MADELFGGYGGSRLAEQDQLNAQYRMGQIAMQPGQQRLTEARAGTAEMGLRQAQRMEQLMQGFDWGAPGGSGGAPGQPQSMSVPYWRMSEIAGRSGNVEQSRRLAATASQVMVREANTGNAMANRDRHILDTQMKRIGLLEGVLSQATDQASFDAGNALFGVQTGIPSPYSGMVYNKEMVKQLTDSLIPAKDRVRNSILQNEYDSRDRNRDSQISHRDFLENHLSTMEDIARAREGRLAKTGVNKPLAAPSKAETDAATALVKTQMFPNLQGDKADPNYLQTLETINAGAKDVAATAKAMLRDNPALDWNTALQRALTESIQAGDWQTVAAGGAFLRKPRQSFRGGGHTAATAMPLPAGTSVDEVRKQMQPGKFYLDPRTHQPLGQWTGTGFSPLAVDTGDNADDEDNLDTEE